MASPPKITAEWCVRAQLTITRPDDKLTNTKPITDNIRTEQPVITEKYFQGDNPIKVVYKWCTSDDKKTCDLDANSSVAFTKNTIINNNVNSKTKQKDSFHTTGITQSDSGFSTTTTNASRSTTFNPKCRSTCNIVLSACTDIIPEPDESSENITTTYYTTIFPNKNEVKR